MKNDWVRSLEFWMNDWNYERPDDYYSLTRAQFQRASMSFWAAEEVIEEVKRHPDQNPIEVLEDFKGRMHKYYYISRTKKARKIFEALNDAADNALDYLAALLFV